MKKLKTHFWILNIVIAGLLSVHSTIYAQSPETLNGKTIQEFCSNLKGFNLLGKFDASWSNQGYAEKQFQAVHDLGFNFVRLPVDYRTYTKPGDWDTFVENEVSEIDAAVAWGKKYNVHVCLNLHRAPGYCVNEASNLPANQQLDLWTDTVAQNAFVNHWNFFAKRYKDISPDLLSFNLVNEPSNVSEEDYVQVMQKAIEEIHTTSPERLIFVDGLNYARDIVLSLKNKPNVAQALHSYDPFQLTHYQASWVNGSDTWSEPEWPMLMVNQYLYGHWKSEFQSPLVFKGQFPAGTKIVVNVHKVSTESTLQIKAGNTVVYSKKFVATADPGDDFTQVVETQWGYQNISNKNYAITIDNPATQLSFENTKGDWMILNSITLVIDSDSIHYKLSDNSWGEKQSVYLVDENYSLKTEDGSEILPFDDYVENFELARENNIPFMVQEFGVYNKTPHETTLAFLDDLIRFFDENQVGWALWNLDESFGILNSGRTDVDYEYWQGFQLDREMYEILAQSITTSAKIDKAETGIEVYPSPAKNRIFIRNSANGHATISLTDLTGRKLKSAQQQTFNNEIITLDVDDIPSGIFILSIQNNGKLFSKKILIQK